jgi:hypothetical protein
MRNVTKLTLLFLVFGTLISCELLGGWYPCGEVDYKSMGNKIQFRNYYSEKYYSKDSLRYNVTQFSFFEDSSFLYLRVWHQKYAGSSTIDTVMRLNGTFKIYKDSDLPWYVLRLNADSIYEKKAKDTLDGILHFTDFASSKFEGLKDSLFYTEDFSKKLEGCFILNTKYSALCQNDWDGPCLYKKGRKYWGLEGTRRFCLEQPEETPEPNPTGDSL